MNITTYYPLNLPNSQPAFNADIEELKIYFSLPNILTGITFSQTGNFLELKKIQDKYKVSDETGQNKLIIEFNNIKSIIEKGMGLEEGAFNFTIDTYDYNKDRYLAGINNNIYVSVRNQKTNKSIFLEGTKLKDKIEVGCYYDELKGYYIKIFNNMIYDENQNQIVNLENLLWTPGELYQLQLQYSVIEREVSEDNQISYKEVAFSEWSQVCYLKATSIKNDIILSVLLDKDENNQIFTPNPRLIGTYNNTNDLEEIETKYKFDLFLNGKLIETSGWKMHSEGKDYYIINTNLTSSEQYFINYNIQTKNNYKDNVEENFIYIEDKDNIPKITIEKTIYENNFNFDEGVIGLTIKPIDVENYPVQGKTFMLRRAEILNDSNVSFQDYISFSFDEENNFYEFKDKLIDSGVEYKYSVCEIKENGQRTGYVESEPILAEYENTFIIGNNLQLKINLDPKITNFKRIIQEAKTETIGSKYPFIRRNGLTSYFSFGLSGLISYKMDEQNLFFNLGENFYDLNYFDINLTTNNIKYEKLFREQVEKFLTNGEYKIFKSPTEGLKIVSIMGVSLTPKDELGRMLYSFTSTLNEVVDYSLQNALKYNIINQEV